MLILFQEAKKVAGEGTGKIVWMVVVALIGWVLLVAGGFVIYRSIPASTPAPLRLFDDAPLTIPTLSATPSASLLPATPSASPRGSVTPRASATPRSSAATSSATP